MLPLASLSKFPFVPIGVLIAFASSMPNLLSMSLMYLTHKCTILHLLDLKTKKVTKLSNHGYLKLISHHLSKLFTKLLVGLSKYDVINIDLQHKQVFANLLGEESDVNLAHNKPFRE
jgi:hypothetical protein